MRLKSNKNNVFYVYVIEKLHRTTFDATQTTEQQQWTSFFWS